MNGARRVVIFCLLTAVLPTILIIIPLYLRHNVFSDVAYKVAESDVLEIGEDISTVFCQDHTLKMNTTFSAYQVYSKPEINTTRKHIRLKKSMRLPDDTLEYWGFFLPAGSTVKLSVCSRFDGSRILVVIGEKNLRTCGLLDHSKPNQSHATTPTPLNRGSIRIRFEVDPDNVPPSDKDIPIYTKVPTTQRTVDTTPSSVINETAPILANSSRETNNNETLTRRSRSTEDSTNVEEDEDVNNAAEDESEDEGDGLETFRLVRKLARELVPTRETSPRTWEEAVLGHRLRHARNRAPGEKMHRTRRKAIVADPIEPHNLDGKVMHGGNAQTHVESEGSSPESSFERELIDCYGGDILLQQAFPSSQQCVNVSYLISNHTGHMTTTHQVTKDAYYYYIFYSDNDLVENDIHAVFNIFKPTYQFSNITKRCVNETTCTFPVAMFTKEIVIVEIPTRDGIEHEDEDFTLLVSVCQPRMSVYIIFPLLVLILILGCAFL